MEVKVFLLLVKYDPHHKYLLPFPHNWKEVDKLHMAALIADGRYWFEKLMTRAYVLEMTLMELPQCKLETFSR